MSKNDHRQVHDIAAKLTASAAGSSNEANAPELATPFISLEDYEAQLHLLQVELVKLPRHFIGCGDKILVLLEGRDAAGKDGSINRSWYNRAGVEYVMGFCTKEQHEEFMLSVPKFEEMLVNSGIKLLKYYLDVSKTEQVRRLEERKRDPLKQWKSSPIDAVAVKHWKAYSEARDAMLLRTHTAVAPWRIVRADNKRLARLNLMRDILSRLHYAGKKNKLVQPDTDIAFEFTPDCIDARRLAR